MSGCTVDTTKSSINAVAAFKLLPIDKNKIFADTTLATSGTDTFLFHDSTMVKDMNGLAVVEIESDAALQTKTVDGDTTKPTVSVVALDMDKLTLTSRFSETLKIEAQANGGAVVEITAGTRSVKDDPAVTLTLDPLDAAAFTLNPTDTSAGGVLSAT